MILTEAAKYKQDQYLKSSQNLEKQLQFRS